MKRNIWLLGGYAGSGKDTVADILHSLLEGAKRSSFAGAVKDEVAGMYEFDRAYLDTAEGKARVVHLADGRHPTIRELLIEHAEGEKQHKGKAIWAEKVHPDPDTRHWILSDWRFPEEYACLRSRFPEATDATIHCVWIHRESVVPLETYTEHSLKGHAEFDYEVNNCGTLSELTDRIHAMIQTIV